MLELLTDPAAWASLLTLTVLEVVLGIDNIIFLSIMTGRLPKEQQARARKIGLMLALIARLMLLFGLSWMTTLTAPIAELWGFAISWRDVVLILGGLFLIYKATGEMHGMLEGEEDQGTAGTATFGAVILQIVMIDVVFSLDSVITAVGIADHLSIMVIAIVIAILVMMFAAGPVAGFVDAHPTVKMLALAFLLLVGLALVADGSHFHIPRGYLYVAIGFSIGVEALNLMAARARARRRTAKRRETGKSG
jgi:predicted tellurium resistance membrane protein TerC